MISVIVPTYNNEDTISRALTSVAGQTYHDWQIVVVNDASTDNTKKVIEENFCAYYKDKIKIIDNEKNMGVGVSRKVGVDNADGEFVIFLDSDDYLIPNCLEMSLELQKQHDADVVYTTLTIVYDKDHITTLEVPNYVMEGKISPALHINYPKKWLTGKMFRTELMKKTPMSPKRIGEDVNTLFFACYLANKVRSCPYSGYVHIYRPGSLIGVGDDRPFYYYCQSALCDLEMFEFVLEHNDTNCFYEMVKIPYINFLSHIEKIKANMISKKELDENKDQWGRIKKWFRKHEDEIKKNCNIDELLKKMNITQ